VPMTSSRCTRQHTQMLPSPQPGTTGVAGNHGQAGGGGGQAHTSQWRLYSETSCAANVLAADALMGKGPLANTGLSADQLQLISTAPGASALPPVHNCRPQVRCPVLAASGVLRCLAHQLSRLMHERRNVMRACTVCACAAPCTSRSTSPSVREKPGLAGKPTRHHCAPRV
jgi:hypothetical protein